MGACTVDDCSKRVIARGYCGTHYWRVREHGSLTLPPRPDQATRFWAKVDRAGDCWLWLGARSGSGYGMFGPGGRGKSPEGAHRMAWLLTYGPIPPNAWILHRCDVRLCVRPEHLFLGSPGDNVADMYAKDRQGKDRGSAGSRNGAAKLMEDQIPIIRQRRAAGETLIRIARDYGVNLTTIEAIAKRQSWRHLP